MNALVSYLISPFILGDNVSRLHRHRLHSASGRVHYSFSERFQHASAALSTAVGRGGRKSDAKCTSEPGEIGSSGGA